MWQTDSKDVVKDQNNVTKEAERCNKGAKRRVKRINMWLWARTCVTITKSQWNI